ncbi:DNA polymerase III subunits gamma and tau [Aureimonas altamirensis]|uniref:DNA polymerase III subunit gamma/tau n=1 Tax=Aureimonas altamirensis TaxID=370622 RepID=A0A0B1Q4V9_9HYPH|nr:DNA polymerase III subunit gamma/tau [Aureimonas altamirensis]KHJ55893.1 DNA polymerase III subunits gamma and tau [Aureimonas altamirensis]
MADRGGQRAYRVLARKYRPQSFDDLIGQEPMVRTLTNAFEAGRIAQAWMLTGVRGVGKTTTARILARALNYETETVHRPSIRMDQPGVHDQAIMEGRHVDVVEMDAASHTGIDDIREIIEQVRYRPVSARYKVYIIDEVHMLSTQAFNGLLKTLEEPPEHVKFVFATTEIRKVPITVLSRCQRFDLRRVEAARMMEHLGKVLGAEGVAVDEEALRLIARASEGSVRDALSLADQAIAHGAGHVGADAVRDMLGLADRARVIDLFEMLMAGDASAAITELRGQYAAGADPLVVLGDLADFTHLVTSLRFVPESAADASLAPVEAERGAALAQSLSVRTLSQVWQMLLKAIEEARLAASPRQAAEMALIRIAYASTLPGPEELLRLVESGASVPAAAATPAPPAPASPHSPGSGGPTGGQTSGMASGMASGPPTGQTGGDGAGVAARVAAPVAERGGVKALAGRGALSLHSFAPEPQAHPVQAAEAEPTISIASLEDIDALALEKRDSLARLRIRRYLRPVRVEAGRLEVGLADDAPATFPGELMRKLHDWTGRRWIVTVATGPVEAPTLEEIAREKREKILRDVAQDPDVAALLSAFPGARIADVRLRAEAVAAGDTGEALEAVEPPDDSAGFDGAALLDDIDPEGELPDEAFAAADDEDDESED